MNDLYGLFAYGCAVWAALLLYDELQNRRRVAAWQARANELRRLRGTP